MEHTDDPGLEATGEHLLRGVAADTAGRLPQSTEVEQLGRKGGGVKNKLPMRGKKQTT